MTHEQTRALQELRRRLAAYDGAAVRVEVWREGCRDGRAVFVLPRSGRRRVLETTALESHLLGLLTWARVRFSQRGEDPGWCEWPYSRPASVPLLAAPEEEKPHPRYSAECAEAVRVILDTAGVRQTGKKLEEALAPSFSQSAVRHTLSEMVKAGRLTNAPRDDGFGVGYGLPGWLPREEAG